ncbi:hypothetical protein BP6252_12659 [Coleophoma cylindrospora]|uniref:Uncharacterized protein n=1 Tax=Coleophoma cylindrospora TaxID=1849047 RepID=A0A3D8QCI9_9HELO|nr:hypothetical protein BP6252_12659 [Coleophoma cylindrospora]
MTDLSPPACKEDGASDGNYPQDDKLIVKWLENQPISQALLAREQLNGFLDRAAQPRHASGNACIKLCYFVEQCRASGSSHIREVAYSQRTCVDLFNFFIEWNEKNQNRSMRQILDLLASLLLKHPEQSTAQSIKTLFIQRLISIVSHQASQPLVKPAFKALECFLTKKTFSAEELFFVYQEERVRVGASNDEKPSVIDIQSWDDFVSEVFDWMALPDIAPAAGKFLVTLFRELRRDSTESSSNATGHAQLWQRWIRDGLSKDPDALENFKNYLFPPLFKLDRDGSLAFLEDLNKQKPMSELKSLDLTAHSFLQLAALEAGKKAGLVEEPATIQFQKAPKKSAKVIVLQEDAIGSVITHSSTSVRSLALSVLVSSSSTIRPFSPTALDILQRSLGILHADTDAKFRNEVLGNTKQFIERLRGSTAFLVREIESLSFVPKTEEDSQRLHSSPVNSPIRTTVGQTEVKDPFLLEEAGKLLSRHEKFIEWYVEFLMGELASTCSYQRHITSLRAIGLLLKSGILGQAGAIQAGKVTDDSTIWPYNIRFFTTVAMRLFLDLLMDPFEDVRSSATGILKFASRDCFTIQPLSRNASQSNLSRRQSTDKGLEKQPRRRQSQAELLDAFTQESKEHWNSRPMGLLMDFIARAEGLSKRTGRADYADGVARAYELLYGLLDTEAARIDLVEDLIRQLERKISIAESDMARAVLVAPVHGQFAALNFVWEVIDHIRISKRTSVDLSVIQESCKAWDDLQWRILYACSRIWEAIKDVLCNDSPEGHLPQDLDDVDDIDTKDVLSYSFRATHDNLMRTMIGKIKSQWQDGSPILPAGLFADIGNLTFNQLASLRHRGAFSTVSLTFSRCCQLALHQSQEEKEAINLLEQWYQGALGCIYEQVSTTRRSAGIPALLTGILSANTSTPSFEDVMAELKDLAKQNVKLSETDETNLPQVHAMNCLKEIFKSSALGKRAESHIADCLQLAADSLSSEIWAIRNCGLILLRSLIDALFGTSESKLIAEAGWDGRSIRLSYDKYPALPELLLKLLDAKVDSDHTVFPSIGAVESVFPALDIIRRAGPPGTQRERIYSAVSTHLGSRVCHIRELAARTICNLMLHDDWLPAVSKLIKSCDVSANRIHGVLLAINFVLDRRLALKLDLNTGDLVQCLSLLTDNFHSSSTIENCSELLAAYFEVLNAFQRIITRLERPTKNLTVLQSTFSSIIPSDVPQQLEKLTKTYSMSAKNPQSSALLRKAIARKAVYIASLTDNLEVLEMSLYVGFADVDTALAMFECISVVFNEHKDVKSLQVLVDLYVKALPSSRSSEVRATALFQLASILDRISLAGHKLSAGLLTQLPRIGALLQDGKASPQLSKAQLRLSGCLFLHEHSYTDSSESTTRDSCDKEQLEQRLETWGQCLTAAGNANNDFDTRFAAVEGLSSFYSYIESSILNPAHLPSLFALYDTLNDDDDDVRDAGAACTSALLGRSLVPLAAAKDFLQWLWKSQGSSPSFAWNVVCRMTGNQDEALEVGQLHLRSAEAQLSEAMAEDESLFVEEEQNLFYDEIREAKVWSVLFEKELHSSWSNAISVLATWVLEGLTVLNLLATKNDGPLGWTSKPAVFAQCMRIIISAKALLRYQASCTIAQLGDEKASNTRLKVPEDTTDKIREELDMLISLSSDKQLHESLIYEILGWPALVLTSSRGAKQAGRRRTLPKRQNSSYSNY